MHTSLIYLMHSFNIQNVLMSTFKTRTYRYNNGSHSITKYTILTFIIDKYLELQVERETILVYACMYSFMFICTYIYIHIYMIMT
jgi:hypothetical protein